MERVLLRQEPCCSGVHDGGPHRLQILLLLLFGSGKTLVAVEFMMGGPQALGPVLEEGKKLW